MNDETLNALLEALARERSVPSEHLLRRTRAAVRGRRLLQFVVFLSLCAQLVFLGGILFLLAAPGVPAAARVCGMVSLYAYAGCLAVAVVAARSHLKQFFSKIEQLAA